VRARHRCAASGGAGNGGKLNRLEMNIDGDVNTAAVTTGHRSRNRRISPGGGTKYNSIALGEVYAISTDHGKPISRGSRALGAAVRDALDVIGRMNARP